MKLDSVMKALAFTMGRIAFCAQDEIGAACSRCTLLPMSTTLRILAFALVLTSAGSCSRAFALGGFPVWTNVFSRGASGLDDLPATVAIDTNGNVFVTGSSDSTNGYSDFATLAFSRSGVCLWTNIYNSTNDYEDWASDLALDSAGNIFVTGITSLTGNSTFAFITFKYSNSGVPVWTNVFKPSINGGESAKKIAVDSNDDAIVTGYFRGGGSVLNNNYATIKYSGAGVPLWTNYFSGPGESDRASAIGVDAGNNVYVTGTSQDKDLKGDFLTVKYASNGVALWTNRFNAGGNDFANSLVVSPNGTAYITGDTAPAAASSADYMTIALSSSGTVLWSRRYGAGNGGDLPSAIGTDANGNVFVTGYSLGVGTGLDYATLKYSAGGIPLWTNRYSGPDSLSDRAYALAVDAQGNVYVTGSSEVNVVSSSLATIAYSGEGIPLWTNFHRNPDPGIDYSTAIGTAIAVDSEGEVYAVGGASIQGPFYDYAIIRYSSLTPQPAPLKITTTTGGVVLTWSSAAFSLQSATSLLSAFTNMPAATNPYTNLITEPQRFFRLKAN
jgi:Beta-propeller repeat